VSFMKRLFEHPLMRQVLAAILLTVAAFLVA
jgi:hypothetical protein